MPPRIARSNLQSAAPKTAKNKNRKRNLDAFAIASHTAQEKNRLRPSRLGESLDDRPKQKRRRADDEDDESEDGEDAPPKRRRAALQDEHEEDGSDSSGNEWTLGGLKEDDSDSELDSDEAFGESDEEKFESFTFRGSKSGSGKKISQRAKVLPNMQNENERDIDLDEGEPKNEDADEDDFGEEGVDLATMLDDDDEEMLGGKDTTARDMGEESMSEDEEDESDNQADSESSDSEGDEEERIARMRDRIDALDASAQPAKVRSTPSQPAALTVEDLLAGLDPAQRKQFSSALKTKKKSERPKTLSAPLPKRQQDKLNREEATKKAKEQLDRWKDTVTRNRRAEFLSFPLNDPSRGQRMGKDKFIVGDDQAPANELEQNIRKIMEESGLATKPGQKPEDEEDMLLKAEELATNKMPVEEVLQRRAELRRARELLFREEIKAKRIKKIKSKAYRRVHRKERLRQEKQEDTLREINGEADLDEDEEERYERKRAEARMSTKHRDSKFAKAMNQTNRTVWDDGAREAVIDEARRREELKRRIQGKEIVNDDDEISDVPSGEEDDSEDDGEEVAIRKKLNYLSGQMDLNPEEVKGLGGMKFMRAADERQRARNEEDIERLRKDMAVVDGDEEESDDAIDDQGLGRAIFGPTGRPERSDRENGSKTKKPEMEEGDMSDDEREDWDEREAEIVTDRLASEPKVSRRKDAVGSVPVAKQSQQAAPNNITKEQPNSETKWATGPLKEDKVQSKNKWASGPGKKDQMRKMMDDNAQLLSLSVEANATERSNAKQAMEAKPLQHTEPAQEDSQAGNTNGWTIVKYKDQENNDSDEAEPSDPIVTAVQEQGNHISRAFAIDDAIKSTFDAEKASAAESEDEKEISTHLPGWGSWTGHGLTKSDKKANAHKKHNPLYKTKVPGVKREDRKDAKLENVIISEKQNRKGKHYMAPILPHGFETKGQYERSLRLPMGPEWSTKEVFQRATRPRVVVKPGTVVEAMERPLG